MKRIILLMMMVVAVVGCSTATPSPTQEAAAEEQDTPSTATLEPVIESTTDVVDIPEGKVGPVGVEGELFYAPFPLEVQLDNDIGEWAEVPTVNMGGEGDPAITFGAAADAENLYLMADVIDNNIISGEHGVNYWNEDSVEFYINATGDLTLNTYEDGVAQVTVPALNVDLPAEEAVISGVQGDSAEATIAAFETDTGYAIEIAIPLETDVWSINPVHGSAIGFQVHLNSASTSDRDNKLIWSVFDTSDSSYQDPSVFGQLIFFEVGQTGFPEPTPTPIPEPTATFEPIEDDAVYLNPDATVEDRVADLMARMTLEEKIGQMTLVEKNSIVETDLIDLHVGALLSGGGGGPEEGNTAADWAAMVDGYQETALQSRLGIPIIYGVDAVHGHSNVYGTVIFPHNIGLGAADNPDLMREIARVTAEEMVATGIYWDYAPVLAVARDIRWGRTYEAYSEDTERVTRLATAYLQGLQGDDLADPLTVVGTPKHYIGDGGAVWGTSTTGSYMIDQGVTEVDEETLRAVHLPPYLDALDNGARSIMISYSSWGGMKMHAQEYLITDVLKDELGFTGFIVSDWQGIDQINPGDYYDSVVTAINAGVDMNMVPYDYVGFIQTMLMAVENGDISEERVDDAVSRILTVKFEMGLFENPYSNPDLLAEVGSDAHRAVARQAVSESLVLLQNENDALPLNADDVPYILVAGDARDIGIQSGGWTIEWQGAKGAITEGTTIFDAITARAGEGTVVEYERFGRLEDDLPYETITCVAVVGEDPYAEGIGDSDDLSLPSADVNTINRLREGCDTVIVLLVSGRPMIVTDVLPQTDAFVAAWLPGTEADGIADVLFGDAPFTGTLPFTWPANMDQLRGEDDSPPLFPYGFGLTTEN